MTTAEPTKTTKPKSPAQELEAWIKAQAWGSSCGWYGVSYAHRHLRVTLPVEGTMPPDFHSGDARGRELTVDLLPVSTLGARLSAMLDEIDGLELLPRMYGIWALREVLTSSRLTTHPAFASAVEKKASYRLAYELEHLHDRARWAGDRPQYFEMRHLRREVLAALGDADQAYWVNRVHVEVFAGLDDAPTTTPATTTATATQEPPAPSVEPAQVRGEAPELLARSDEDERAPLLGREVAYLLGAPELLPAEDHAVTREVWLDYARVVCPDLRPADEEMAVKLAQRWGYPREEVAIRNCLSLARQFSQPRAPAYEDAVLVEPKPSAPQVQQPQELQSPKSQLGQELHAPQDPEETARLRYFALVFDPSQAHDPATPPPMGEAFAVEMRARREARAAWLRAELEQLHADGWTAPQIAALQDRPLEEVAPQVEALEAAARERQAAQAFALTPCLPILKRCTSSARGSVCGAEAHTEEEVASLFGYRQVGPKRYAQSQCKACKGALNVESGKRRTERRSQERAQADKQLDLTKPRPDYFARLRALCGLVIDGQWVGEGLTTSRPPKLDAGDPERLLVTCDAGALRCALSPLGEWTVRAEESPKATPTQLAAWVRAAAVVMVALDVEPGALDKGGYGYALYLTEAWVRRIKAAREEVKP